MKAKFRLGETVKIVGNRKGVIIRIHTGTLGNKYYDLKNIKRTEAAPDYYFAVAESALGKIRKLSKENETKGMKIGRRVSVKSAMEIGRKKKSKK